MKDHTKQTTEISENITETFCFVIFITDAV